MSDGTRAGSACGRVPGARGDRSAVRGRDHRRDDGRCRGLLALRRAGRGPGGMSIDIRDLGCFDRPARLPWIKRRWRCVDPDCEAKTWTEGSEHVDAQARLAPVT